MENNENQYEIIFWETSPEEYGRRHIVKVPVSKEAFDDYYRDINAYRKKEQRHGRCACPESKRLLCNMDCGNCPYTTAGDMSSLNEQIEDDDGNSIEVIDTIADEPDYDAEMIHELHKQIEQLTPDYREICNLMLEGKTEREIGEIISKDHKTVHYHKEKIIDILREKLSEIFF